MAVLGIDIGKREVFVNLQDSGGGSAPQVLGHLGLIANTAAGFQQLEEWLKKRVGNIREVKVVMEATSVYWERCAYFFHRATSKSEITLHSRSHQQSVKENQRHPSTTASSVCT